MNRAIGFDLGLSITGWAVFDEGPRLVARGAIRPPTTCQEAQDAASIVATEALRVITRYGGRVFSEAPILNAWGTRHGQRVNMTSSQTALSKGRLHGSFEDRLRERRIPYDMIGIARWRAVLGFDHGGGKEAILAQLEEWLAQRGVRFERGTTEDEKEACGVACAGLVAIRDPRVLDPKWKRPKRQMFTAKQLQKATGGLINGNRQ